MAFCINCGCKLTDGAKFCYECGKQVEAPEVNKKTQRTMVYDGEIHKCPNCGDILDAHELVCESCGYERRGGVVTHSIQEFTESISLAATELDKATIIRNYPIPNTKEDIFEFLILSSSNITGQTSRVVFDAWVAKIEQCYKKARVSYLHAPDFKKIQMIYDDVNKKITKERNKLRVLPMGGILSLARKALVHPVLSLAFVGVCALFISNIVNDDFVPGHIILYIGILALGNAVDHKIRKK